MREIASAARRTFEIIAVALVSRLAGKLSLFVKPRAALGNMSALGVTARGTDELVIEVAKRFVEGQLPESR
ncbi:hypothetical protein [Caballeronia glebae]|uniref:hypothetical protein n=1 Tax=Caballeronia glebae TaxID=1777143 RepID=UPI000B362880|nr:hypothetical protein [Caballeronia glebae]